MEHLVRRTLGIGTGLALSMALAPGLALAQSPAELVPLVPTIDLSTIGGEGEGELNIIAWAGYAEDGSNLPEYDWVNAFEQQTGCQVNVKIDDTSDQMVTDMRTGAYDGVSASGDASLRLIKAGDVVPVDATTMPGFSDMPEFLQNAPHYFVDGQHYGLPHGYGGNLLMVNTDTISPEPTSWASVFEPAQVEAYSGLVTAYDAPIYIADAALYLKSARPELGITDVYELTQEQFDAAVELLKAQAPHVGKYWSLFSDEIDNFANGSTAIGTAWPYQLNTVLALGVPVKGIVPSEGMTGWADTWMLSAKAAHPNCMLKWMAWMLTPEVNAMVAEYFGESPANPLACQYLDVGFGSYALPGYCEAYRVEDPEFYDSIAFWKTPLADCGDQRGEACLDFEAWTNAWNDIRGG